MTSSGDLSGKMGYANAKQIMKPKALFLNATPKPIESQHLFSKIYLLAKSTL